MFWRVETLGRLSVAITVLPILVATVRALSLGWIPIGDNALFLLRSRDVFTRHHPLLGTWTSASHSLGESVNNPGPALFDLLSIPAKVGGGAGVAVGIAALNVVSIVGIALVARRRGGDIAVVAAMVMSGGLVWTLGSELLFDPWQPHSLLFPFLLFLVLAWSVSAGDWSALPWLAAVATLVIQTHLSYALIVPLLSAFSVVCGVVAARRVRIDGNVDTANTRRSVMRSVAATGATLTVLWAQPVIEQIAGDGNLAALLRGALRRDASTIGPELGTRLVGAVVSLPPFWSRPSFEETLNPFGLDQLPSVTWAAVTLVAVGAGLIASWFALRRRDASVSAPVALATTAIALSLWTVAALPRGEFGVAAHQLRFLWPVALFATFAVVLTGVHLLGIARRTVAAVVLLSVVALLAGGSLPSHNVRAGPSADAASIPTTRALLRQLNRFDWAEHPAPVLFDVSSLRFAEPYSVPVLAELQRLGVEFQLDDEGWSDQLGQSRLYPSAEDFTQARTRRARIRMIEPGGDAAFTPPPGAVLVARVVGLSEESRRELTALETEVADQIRRSGLVLTSRGRVANDFGAIAVDSDRDGSLNNPESVIPNRQLPVLIRERLIAVDPVWRGRFERYAQLQERWDHQTVAIFLVSLTE